MALDTIWDKLPGLAPGSFSVVDARDVALAHLAAASKGRRGERYLAAGRHMTMPDLIPLVGRIAGVATPKRSLSMPLLYGIAAIQEAYARLSGKPVLLSLATVRLMAREVDRSRFDHTKNERELGITFATRWRGIATTAGYRKRPPAKRRNARRFATAMRGAWRIRVRLNPACATCRSALTTGGTSRYSAARPT